MKEGYSACQSDVIKTLDVGDHVQTLTQPSHPLGGHGDPNNVTLPVTLPLGNVTLALPLFTTSLWSAEYPSFITLLLNQHFNEPAGLCHLPQRICPSKSIPILCH